jgi:hypothetical protein
MYSSVGMFVALSASEIVLRDARNQKPLAQQAERIEAVCVFLPLAMRYARSSFAWKLACATCILRDVGQD